MALPQVVTAEMGEMGQAPRLNLTTNIIKMDRVAPMVATGGMVVQQTMRPEVLPVMEVTMTSQNICKRYRTLLRCFTLIKVLHSDTGGFNALRLCLSGITDPFSLFLMVETAGTVVRVKTEGMAVTAVMLAQAPIQMAEMAEMAAQTEPMRVLAASAGRVAVAGMREDMMVLPG